MKRSLYNTPKVLVEIISSLFIVVFAHSAISSFIRIQSLKNLLVFYTQDVSLVAWCIICIEILIVTLLVIPKFRNFGFSMVLFTTLSFAATLWFAPRRPHDFEGILDYLTRGEQWILVVVIVVLSVIGIIFNNTRISTLSTAETYK